MACLTVLDLLLSLLIPSRSVDATALLGFRARLELADIGHLDPGGRGA